jgi:drug/metabolite transporter (DMT)-like permease
MSFALVMHVFVVFFSIPFPGYDHHLTTTIDDSESLSESSIDDGSSQRTYTPSLISLESVKPKQLPLSMYFILAIPAMLDLGATAFGIAGLLYLDVSIFQMISNSNIVFVALMKNFIFKNLLYKFQWVGVFWIVVSVFIGGSNALLESRISGNVTDGSGVNATDTLVGVVLVMAGAALFAVQTVMEEKLMKVDVPVPPLLLDGMQGLWGVVLSILVMFPVG